MFCVMLDGLKINFFFLEIELNVYFGLRSVLGVGDIMASEIDFVFYFL